MQDLKQLYDVITLLGKGGFGSVFKVRRFEDDKIYALKVMTMAVNYDHIKREFNILKTLDSEFIPKYYELSIATYKGVQFHTLLMEYIDGHDLSDYIVKKIDTKTSITLEELLSVARDVAKAISYLHSKNIAHRDIKPQNIMVTPERTLLVDYGFSCIANLNSEYACSGHPGTLGYIAPEALEKHIEKDLDLWLKADMFSFGQTLWVLVELRNPTPGKQQPSNYPVPEINMLINRLTNQDPRMRLSAMGSVTMINKYVRKYFPDAHR